MMSPSNHENPAGAFATWIALPWPWPIDRSIALVHHSFRNAALKVICEPPDRIRVDLYEVGKSGPTMSVLSCPISAVEPPFVFLATSFELANALFVVINDTVVASSDASQEVPDHYPVPKRRETPASPREDFSKESATAIRRRRDTASGTHRHPNKVPGDDAYIRGQLLNEAKQLKDLLELLEGGGIHHAAGLAARLRLLVADGRPLPLLQLAAAEVNADLTVYTCARPREPVPMPLAPELFVSFEVSGQPSAIYNNPIDLDVWLSLHAATAKGRGYAHRETIKAIGNTAGAHIDRDIHPLVSALRSTKSAAIGGEEYDLVVDYVRHLAIVALGLSQKIIALGESDPATA